MRQAAILLLLLSSACGGARDVEIRYEVKSESGASISNVGYGIAGDSAVETDVGMPWTKTVRVRPGTILVLTAQRGRFDGDLVVSIIQDGRVIATSRSSGAHSSASTSAVAG